jgi:peptidoglycan/xylan/chitin deacetylase (PgdA/CDA1 family)
MGIGSRRLILVYHTFSEGDESKVHDGSYYGRQGAVSTDSLEAHLKWLSEFARFVPLREIVKTTHENNSTYMEDWEVAVTLDDGYRNNLTLGLPLFERFEVPVTWFVSTGFVEGDDLPWWDLVDYTARVARPSLSIDTGRSQSAFDLSVAEDRTHFRTACQKWFLEAPADVSRRVRDQIEERIPGGMPENAFASRSEILEASRSPRIQLGGHTVSHPNLANRPAKNVRQEVRSGKRKLEAWTDQSVRWFAYPYGGRNHWRDHTKDIVKGEGFEGAVTTERAYVHQANDRFEIPRLTVPNTRALWKAKAWILATNTCRELFRLKQKLLG